LAFEEAGDFIELVGGDGGEEVGGYFHLVSEDEGLVFQDGDGEREGGYVDVFVGHVDSGVALDVAEEVHGLIGVRDGVCLISYEII